MLYKKSKILSFWLQHIIRYRRGVIDKNLDFVFPNKSKEEKSIITNDFYGNLSDIIFETLLVFSNSSDKIIPRLKFVNPELVVPHVKAGQNIVVMGGHLANWEWPNIAIPSQIGFQMVSLIKPLSNPFINGYINAKRSQTGARMLSIYGSARMLLKTHDPPLGLVFISDQNTPNTDNFAMASFFGHPTKFLHGAQQLAIKKNYPIYTTIIKRVSRGQYTMEVKLLDANPENTTVELITKKYVQFLESAIKACPGDWVWSHKRWKNQLNY